MSGPSNAELARRAFAYLVQQHIEAHLNDPVGDYLLSLIGRQASTEQAVTVEKALPAAQKAINVPVVEEAPSRPMLDTEEGYHPAPELRDAIASIRQAKQTGADIDIEAIVASTNLKPEGVKAMVEIVTDPKSASNKTASRQKGNYKPRTEEQRRAASIHMKAVRARKAEMERLKRQMNGEDYQLPPGKQAACI